MREVIRNAKSKSIIFLSQSLTARTRKESLSFPITNCENLKKPPFPISHFSIPQHPLLAEPNSVQLNYVYIIKQLFILAINEMYIYIYTHVNDEEKKKRQKATAPLFLFLFPFPPFPNP